MQAIKLKHLILPLSFLFLIVSCQDNSAAREAELLKKENELLQRENELLKKEKELAEQTPAPVVKDNTQKTPPEPTTEPQAAQEGLVRVGTHNLTLQWISWDYPGKAEVTALGGNTYRVQGEQLSKENDDYLKIDGTLTAVSKQELHFDGRIEYKINHINNGKPCVKTGTKIFKSRGTRKYWRLQDLKNCEDITTDYVDLYF